MPTVIHQLADAFLKRKQALSEGKRAKSVLPGSDYFMPKSAKQDLNNRLSVFEQGGLPELLKQGASEMYHNPIVNTAISLTPGAGDVQSGYEAVQSAKEGKWGEAGLNALGVLPFIPSMGMIGKTVWHGSPHSFDKFDLSKIGTGEGAQAYGHGLYLAESPDVAGSYRTAGDMGWFEREADKALYSQDIDNAIASTKKELERVSKEPRYVDAKNNLTGVLNVLEARKAGANEYGSLYKVDLPDEQIAKMLDWDKPIGQQSKEAQAAIQATQQYLPQNAMDDLGGDLSLLYGKDVTPNQFLNTWESLTGTTGSGEKALLEQGIPGIQYLDQASRGAGEGTRNYVVFSDEIPKILERNGTSVFEFSKD